MKTLILFPLLRLLAFTAILSSVLAVEEVAPAFAGQAGQVRAGHYADDASMAR